jgi:hypothetical protein
MDLLNFAYKFGDLSKEQNLNRIVEILKIRANRTENIQKDTLSALFLILPY